MVKRKKKYNQGGALGSTLGTTLGGLAGQALIPIPGVGYEVGSALGGLTGNLIGNQFGNQFGGQHTPKPPNQSVMPEQFQYNQSGGLNPAGNSFGYALGGDLTQYKGLSHEQGGIALGQTNNEVEGNEVRIGDYIFSDRLVVPNQKSSFAEMANGINRKYKNAKGDTIATDTMNRELAQLAQVQEGEKQKKQLAQKAQQYSSNRPENISQPVAPQQTEGLPINDQGATAELKAFGGGVNKLQDGGDGEPWKIGDIFAGRKYASRANAPELQLNQFAKDNPNYNPPKDNWFNNQFLKSGMSSYSGNPYSSLKVGVKIPIAGGGNKTVNPKLTVNPAYAYTPKGKEGTFYGDHIGNQYIPNLRFWGDNNIGKHIWGESKNNSDYNFTGVDNNQPNVKSFSNPNIPDYSKTYNKKLVPYNIKEPVTQKAFGGPINKLWAGGDGDIPPISNYSTFKNIAERNGSSPFNDISKKETYGTDGNLAGVSYTSRTVDPTRQSIEYGKGYVYKPGDYSNRGSDGVLRDMYGNPIPENLSQQKDNLGGMQIGNGYYQSVGKKPMNYKLNNKLPGLTKLPIKNNIVVSASGKNNPNLSTKLKGLSNGKGLGLNANDLTKTGLSTLGGLYDVFRGMQGGQYESYGRVNPVTLQQLDPTRNIQQQREAGATGLSKVRNVGGQGLGQYLNNVNAVTSNTQKNVGNTVAQYDNANVGIQNQQTGMNNQIQSQNLQMDVMQNDINAKERDAASNDIQHGLTTISQGLNQQFQDQSQRQVQDQVITNLLSTKNYQYAQDNQGNYIMTTNRGNFKIDAKGNVYDDKGKVVGDVNTFDFGTQNNGILANNYNSGTMGPLPQ